MTDKVADDDDDDYKVIPWIASSKSSDQKEYQWIIEPKILLMSLRFFI